MSERNGGRLGDDFTSLSLKEIEKQYRTMQSKTSGHQSRNQSRSSNRHSTVKSSNKVFNYKKKKSIGKTPKITTDQSNKECTSDYS